MSYYLYNINSFSKETRKSLKKTIENLNLLNMVFKVYSSEHYSNDLMDKEKLKEIQEVLMIQNKRLIDLEEQVSELKKSHDKNNALETRKTIDDKKTGKNFIYENQEITQSDFKTSKFL